MIDNVAESPSSASAGAGVDAFLVAARLFPRALGVHGALGSTVSVGIAKVVWQAAARALAALGVRAARRRVAGILWYDFVYKNKL